MLHVIATGSRAIVTLGLVAMGITASATAPAAAFAGDTATWFFEVETTGQDVFWTSRDSVDPDADLYEAVFEITHVEVDVEWFNVPFNNIDITDQLPKELLMGGGSIEGPAPIVLLDVVFTFPEPPDPTCVAAQLLIGLNAAGFGFVEATEVDLGTCDIDIGFGTITVDLKRLEIAGFVEVTPMDLTIPGDIDGDGVVGSADLVMLLGAWGDCGDCAACPEDLDGDCTVGSTDLLVLLGNWG